MLTGTAHAAASLTQDEIAAVVAGGLEAHAWQGRDVLVLVPDATREAPIDRLFPLVADRLARDVRRLDVLVATGTHHPPPRAETLDRLGLGPAGAGDRAARIGVSAHVYDDARGLRLAGTIPGDEIAELSGGLHRDDLPVTLNRRLFEYDRVIILGPVAPHEAAGFSGGHKYLIPGVAGAEVISAFHWLAALITNPRINGIKDNPVRRILDRGVALAGLDLLCVSFVVRRDGGLGCLYVGSAAESWSRAADYSAAHHIVQVPRAYATVVGMAPRHLHDLWVGGKVMYKHEPIVADGGELVIYAPHVTEISRVHGAGIRNVGYHVRDYFLEQWDRFEGHSKLVLAHSTNVRGIGTFTGGIERPRVQVTLATGIPEDVCRAVNLGYRDPATIDLPALRRREEEGVLVVEDAGQDLYRLVPGVPQP